MGRGDWQESLKRRVSRLAHGSGRRPVLQGMYGGLIAAETAVASAWVGRHGRGPVDPGNLTLVVKTFERPDVLRRMLASVRRVFSGPIVVADDSRVTFVSDDPGVRVLPLPFDSGIGAGRNALLAAVGTPYVFMTDDDMVLLPDFDVQRPIDYLTRHPEVDVVGGRVVHLPLGRTADYSTAALHAYRGEPRVRAGTIIDGLPVAYKVPNFYVARTDAVRSIGYDDRLKRVDHNDFFTSAYGHLVCVVDPQVVCLHAHSYFDGHYQGFRMDTAGDLALIAEKWGHEQVPGLGAASGGLADEHRVAFHHAAVEVVARDLGVRVVHDRVAAHAAVAVEGDPEPLVAVLRAMGWAGRRSRYTHALWGVLDVTAASPEALREAVPSSFALVDGLAGADAGWPAATGRASDGEPGAGVRWSPRAAIIGRPDAVLAALLPAGPVLTITPPGDALFAALGPEPRDADSLIAELLADTDAPPEAAGQLREFLEVLIRQGVVDRCGDSNTNKDE